MKISVALAACNGGKYITEQLGSILPQLSENDEIIVSDDNPAGDTRGAVEAVGDSRIIYIEGEGKGVVKNFENALAHTTGELIFLCDQDDVWLPGKVSAVTDAIKSGSDLVLHDARIVDENLSEISPSYFALHGTNTSFARNIIRNTFVGCCMAFTKEVLAECLPFPDVPMHDWWIALEAMKRGRRVTLIDSPLILWRRHGNNVTGGKTGLLQKIRWRSDILKAVSGIKKGK